MRRVFLPGLVAGVLCFGTPAVFAQVPKANPLYSVTINVVERNIKAVNFKVRGGSTRLDFKGTALQPDAEGHVKVESKTGFVEVDSDFEKLHPATTFGPEYLTYVMWAITPEGRARNLGELILDDKEGKLLVTTDLQAFGLIVTAEPYFAVVQPSDVVVLEGMIRKDTAGSIERIDAKFDLLKRGVYVVNANPSELTPYPLDPKTPLDLSQARNAVRIAAWAGAQFNAIETLQKAQGLLSQAEAEQRKGSNKKIVSTVARQAVQTAEDARLISVKRAEETQRLSERQSAEKRVMEARELAEREALMRTEADAAKLRADSAQRIEAERRARAEADEQAARQQAEVARLEASRVREAAQERAARDQAEVARLAASRVRAEAEEHAAQQQAEAARQQAEAAQQQAGAALQEAEAARQQAEIARVDAERSKAEAANSKVAANRSIEDARRAESQASEARLAAQRADKDRSDLRADLNRQLNIVMETRDTARGLIVSMADVLFDTGQYTLKTGAREKLAKVSGILLAHPGLLLEVEGHTDSVGSDEVNQVLSERRAGAVKDYLVQQGITPSAVVARGFGKAMPAVSNDTSEGRQRNRRVELVVSGDIIGPGIVALNH